MEHQNQEAWVPIGQNIIESFPKTTLRNKKLDQHYHSKSMLRFDAIAVLL